MAHRSAFFYSLHLVEMILVHSLIGVLLKCHVDQLVIVDLCELLLDLLSHSMVVLDADHPVAESLARVRLLGHVLGGERRLLLRVLCHLLHARRWQLVLVVLNQGHKFLKEIRSTKLFLDGGPLGLGLAQKHYNGLTEHFHVDGRVGEAFELCQLPLGDLLHTLSG